MLDRGSPTGLTGLLDLPNVTGATRKFAAWIYAYAETLTAGTDSRAGRGDGDWPEQAYTTSAGTLALTCELRADGYLVPDDFRGQAGTVTIDHGCGVTQSVPVRVTGVSLKYDSGKNSTDVTGFACQVTDMPTWSGVGGGAVQPSDDAPGDGAADKTLWAGLTKTEDPSGLSDAETLTIDAWAVADTDDDEWAKLAAVVAAAAPSKTGLKLRPVTFRRLSARRCQISLTWALTSTADDQILPRTTLSVDPSGIGSTATTAALNDVAPSAPAGDNFVLRDTQTVALSDGNTVTVGVYGKTTRQQDLENPGTFTRVDPSGLESAGQETRVYDSAGAAPSATVPAGLQLVGTNTQTINPDRDQVQYFYAKDTPQQRAEQAETFAFVDPNNLESEGAVAAMDADPTLPDGYVAVGTRTKNLTHDHALNVLAYGLLDSKDRVEMPGTWYEVDPNAIETRGLDTAVFATLDGEPDDPTPAHGTKIVARQVVEINRLSSKRVITLGLADSADKLVLAETAVVVDPAGLRSSEATAAVGTAAPAATVAGFVLRTTRTTHPVPGVDLNVAEYGTRDTIDDVEMPRTFTYADPDAINSKGAAAEVYATLDGEPGDATPPLAELKVVGTRTEELDQTSSVKVTEFDTATAAEKMTLPKTVEVVDPNGLRTVKAAAALNATPSTPAGLVLRTTRTEHPTGSSTLVTVEAGTRDTVDDEEMPGTWTESDPQGIRDRGLRTEVYATTDGLPLDPTPPAGQKIRSTRTQELDRTHSTRVDEFGLNDSKDDVEQAGTATSIDPDGIEDADAKTSVTASSTPPDATGALAPRAGLSLVGTTFRPLPGGHYAHRLLYAPLTSAERIEHRATTANYDPIRGDARETATVVTCLATDTAASLAAAAFAANQTSIAFASASFTKLHKTRALQIIREIDRDRLVRSEMSPIRPEDMKFRRPVSIGDTAAYVRVAELAVPGALSTSARLTHYSYPRQRGVVEILRYVAVLAGGEGAALNAGWAGTVNVADLAGFPARTLMYGLPNIRRRWGLGGGVTAYLLEVANRLTYDSLGHPDDSRLAVGWVNTTDAATQIGTTGDTLAASYFGVDWVLSWPDQTDMSSLLA